MSGCARQNRGGRGGGQQRGSESWGQGGKPCGGGGRRKGGELCGGGELSGGGCRRGGECGSGDGSRRQWREVERVPGVDGVVGQAVASPDGLNTHAEAAREGVESVTRLYNVHDPVERRAAVVGPWSGAGVEGGRQVNLLARIDDRCAQAVGLHQRVGGDTSPPGQAGECVSPLHDVDNPAWRSRTTRQQR